MNINSINGLSYFETGGIFKGTLKEDDIV